MLSQFYDKTVTKTFIALLL